MGKVICCIFEIQFQEKFVQKINDGQFKLNTALHENN